ncbi:MAG TPA: hypothetical protein VKW76_00525 [Candidatus Binatia bacterium]|nr:hypothetical protein [Candidatus Binatia bacterium]
MGKRVGLGVALVGAAVLGAAVAGATGAVKLRTALVPTAKAPKARGATKLQLKHGARGRFVVTARRLAPNATFDVVVGGVKVGTLTTNHAGGGKLKLSTSPHGREALLGFDPRGSQIAVRDEGGDDDLVGDEPAGDSASGACCLRDHEGETECEDVAPADCTKAGGTPSPATSCLPDPCTGTPPPVQKIVCCIANSAHGAFVDEDPEVECEHVDNQADCASAGGTVVQGTSCEGDPCAPTPPATRVACCLSGEGESECAMLTAESCAAHHGTAATAPSCESHPCGGGDEPPTGQHGDHHGGDDQG